MLFEVSVVVESDEVLLKIEVSNDGKRLRLRRTRMARLGIERSIMIGANVMSKSRAGIANIPAMINRRRWGNAIIVEILCTGC